MNIEFRKSRGVTSGKASGTVSGSLHTQNPAPGQETFLGELSDVHPDFAAHLVKAVNTYAALQKVLQQQGPSGSVAAALRAVLSPSP